MADSDLDPDKFRMCGDRRYHGSAINPYLYPNDAEEHSRLANMHVIFRSIWGCNVMVDLSPSAERILDVGTGAGNWAVDVAKEFPATRVVGMDISPVGHLEEIPPNLEFVFGDLTSDLQHFQDGSIDLIHSRGIATGVRKDQWPGYIGHIFRLLKPGVGFAQVSELGQVHVVDDSVPNDSFYGKFRRMFGTILDRRGLYTTFEHMKIYFQTAGFVDIQMHTRPIFLGDWAGDPELRSVWYKAREAFIDSLPGLTGCLEEFFPTENARKEFADDLVAEMRIADYHIYWTNHMVTARKPDFTDAINQDNLSGS